MRFMPEEVRRDMIAASGFGAAVSFFVTAEQALDPSDLPEHPFAIDAFDCSQTPNAKSPRSGERGLCEGEEAISGWA